MKDWAVRFADQLLKDNLQLEEFQVSLIDYDHFDEIVQRLEEMGCKVRVDRSRRRLTVQCPREGKGAGRSEEPPKDKRSYRHCAVPKSVSKVRRDEAKRARDRRPTVADAVMSLIHLDACTQTAVG